VPVKIRIRKNLDEVIQSILNFYVLVTDKVGHTNRSKNEYHCCVKCDILHFGRICRRFGRKYYLTNVQEKTVNFYKTSQKMTVFTESPTETFLPGLMKKKWGLMNDAKKCNGSFYLHYFEELIISHVFGVSNSLSFLH
jgi:hypothetical protein